MLYTMLPAVHPFEVFVRAQDTSVEMDNISTKTSSRDDGLVDRLSISKNMLHKPYLYATRSGPQNSGHYSQGITHQGSYSPQYRLRQ